MLPSSQLSASEALVTSVLGQHSGVDVILKDRQHYDIARVQITRSLRMSFGHILFEHGTEHSQQA
jgi:hypothetical protein